VTAVPPLPEVPGVRHSHHDLPTGVQLHVAEAGDPDAPAVLAVHGWPQHWWMWRHVIPALSERRRVVCPDLRGLGWSGFPGDGDYTKGRMAEDLEALLDRLGIERAGYLGHDWGGWIGWLLALRAPERIERLMAVSIVHPWVPREETLRHAWRLGYMLALATPGLGPAVVRDGRAVRAALGSRVADSDAAVYVDVLRDPDRAAASSAYYRHFQLREVPRLGELAGASLPMPVRVLFGRHDPVQRPSQLAGLEHHAAELEVEVVDGGHFLVDERPALVADRARAWFG
jgi:pimeloyl-ACP methyl ester carboxylesterase